MGISLSSRSKPDYTVHVKTGDRKGAGTDANVYIALHNDQGTRSRDIHLDSKWRDDFERGRVDRFPVKKLPHFGDVVRVELWRDSAGLGSDWYVDLVEVVNEETKKRHIFPVHRWIKDKIVLSEFDLLLPQDDDLVDQRNAELMKKRETYEFKCKAEGLMPMVKKFPRDESFSNDYQWDIAKQFASLGIHATVSSLTSRGPWKKLDDMCEVFSDDGHFPRPRGMENWRSDKEFGYLRLAGCNAAVQIRLCTQIPDKLPVTDEMLKPLLEDMTIAEAIEKKRLFMIDYEILKDLSLIESRVHPAPIGLFFVNKDKNLMPVAIQLFQDPGEENPIFLPSDQEYVWMSAKMWFNLADGSFHQFSTHLGMTHLAMESVVVATHRCLSPSHPIFRLLAPHFLYLLAINEKGLGELMNPGGYIDQMMLGGVKGMFEIIRRSWATWSLDRQGSLLNDLKERGVADPEVLPNYHYRDDALLIHEAIYAYVKTIVDQYYSSNDRVTSDTELQDWAKTLSTNGEGDQCCGMKGVPNDGEFKTPDEVSGTVTSFIFICSVGHAAANFLMYDLYAFPPNSTGILHGVPIKDKTDRSESDIVAMMPTKKEMLAAMVVVKVLSGRGTNALGDFEVQYIYDPVGVKAVEKFRSDLVKVGAIIDERNATREHKYDYIHPKEVPNSISI